MFKINKRLTIILIILFLKGIIWAIIIPPLQTPDEPVHFEYIQYMGEENRVPVMRETGQYSEEMLLFYKSVNLNGVAYKSNNKYKINIEKYNQVTESMNHEARTSNGSSVAAGYPPIYYFIGSLIYKIFYFSNIFIRYYAIKFLSIIFGLVTVFLAYVIGRKLETNSENFAIVLALMIGLNPMFSMVSISVNNDILMDVTSVAILLSIIYIFQFPNNKRLLISGLLIGVGLLIKPTMIFVCAVALLALLIFYIKQKYPLVLTIKSSLWIVTPIVIIYLPWGLFSLHHYNSLTGGIGMQPPGDPNVGLDWYIKNAFLTNAAIKRSFELWIISFWANFGWLDTRFKTNLIYYLLAFISVVGTIGASYGIIKKKENYKTVAICLGIIIANILFLYLVEIQYFYKFHNFMLQGRYIFTSLVPINIVLIYGFCYLLPERFKQYIYYTIVLLMFIFNIGSLNLIYHRYY